LNNNIYYYSALDNSFYRDEINTNEDKKKQLEQIEFILPLKKKELQSLLKNNLSCLIFGITNKCNFKCKYCHYTGVYPELFNENKNLLNINYYAIYDSLNYFYLHSKDVSVINIGFYGGEPLLEAEKILKIIYKAKKLFGERVKFSITTNCSLINNEIASEFVKNNVIICVSLDGPKKIHNKNRITNTNKETFDIVIKNLKILKRKYGNKYKELVGFHCVISSLKDLKVVNHFFTNNELTCKNEVLVSTRYEFGFKEKENTIDINLHEYKNILNSYINDITADNSPKNKIIHSVFRKLLLSIIFREIGYIHNKLVPPGLCIPGTHKAYLDSDLNFYICERVGSIYPIGDLHNKLDSNLIYDLLKQYINFFNRYCKRCWAIRFCMNCFASTFDKNGLSQERLQYSCESNRSMISDALYIYCSSLEINEHSFDNWEFSKE